MKKSICPTKLLLVIFAFVLSTISVCSAQYQQIFFDRISTDEGLSQSTINYIIQDKSGFMWFATYDGLCKYDGYNFKVYQPDNNDPGSISSKSVIFLYEDSKGYIWVVNNRHTGVDRLNPETDKFDHFTSDPDDKNGLEQQSVFHVMEDRNGNIWICGQNTIFRLIETGEEDNYSFDKYEKPPSYTEFTQIFENKRGEIFVFSDSLLHLDTKQNTLVNTGTSLNNAAITGVTEDEKGDLWLSTISHGIIKLVYDDANKSYAMGNLGVLDSIKSQHTVLCLDHNEDLWIGTDSEGLFRYRTDINILENYLPNNLDNRTISDKTIYALYEDASHVLWVGTFSEGLCKYDFNSKKFFHFYNNPGDPNSINGDVVSSIHGINEKEIWVGMDVGGGINRVNFRENTEPVITRYIHDEKDPNSIPSNNILCLVQRKNGDVWIGSANGNISILKPEPLASGLKPQVKVFIVRRWTFSIYEDSDGVLWGGTWGHGLWRYDDQHQKFDFFKADPEVENSLHDNIIWSISEDKHKNIWIGGHGAGIAVLTRDEKNKPSPKFIHIAQNDNKSGTLSNNTINAIGFSSTGKPWICTADGLNGVLNYQEITSTFEDFPELEFETYYESDGLPTNGTVGILEDNFGKLWISTGFGISKFDPDNNTFENYNIRHGLQSNEFWHNAYFKNGDGMLFFGGKNGFNAFYPEQISVNQYSPNVALTELKLFNKKVNVGDTINGQVVLDKTINSISALELNHKNNILSLEFAALHLAQPSLINYAYYLEGFEDDWNDISHTRSATYTNLDPGEYTFRVKATNSDQVWSDKQIALKIIVIPPWWKTIYFRVSIPILLTLIILGIFRIRLRFLRNQKKKLEENVQKRTYELNYKNQEIATQNEELQALSEELTSQNEQLEILNGEIIKQKEQISGINETLESKVEERTRQLNRTIDELNKTIAELDRFVYSASHDLSAPLKSMKGILNLTKYDDLNADVQQKIEYLQESINKLEAVIESLTEFSRNSRLELKISEVFVHDLIMDCFTDLKYLKPNYEVDFLINIEPTLKIKTDRLRLTTITNNLISNALKYQDDAKKEHFIKVRFREDNKSWKFEFEDNGIGIAPSERMKIFNMFHRGTEKSTGSGLGLYIVKETLAKLNGDIQYVSEENIGTTFTVILPKTNP